VTDTSTGRQSGESPALSEDCDDIERCTDDELLVRARLSSASPAAVGELYRRHAPVARRVARRLLYDRDDADDVVNDAFAGVMAAIANGSGPSSNFGHYIMASVRNACRVRRRGPVVVHDQHLVDRSHPVSDDANRIAEAGLVAAAFASLSPVWQRTLWLTAVEGRTTSEVALQLGRRPGAVASLTRRAREAFAEAYLAEHRTRPASVECLRMNPTLARYVRRRIGPTDRAKVEHHLRHCASCRRAVDDLRDLNASLRTLVGGGLLVESLSLTASGVVTSTAGIALFGTRRIIDLVGAVASKALLAGAVLVPAVVVASASISGSPARERPVQHVVTPTTDAPSPSVGVSSLVTPTFAGLDTAISAADPATTVPAPIPTDVTVPPGTLPPMTLPPITLPPVTSPVTIPSIGLPGVTVPAVTVPSVTLSAVTVPSVTVLPSDPPITLPPIIIP
jgi:RNA polymerase sigma factor (sigma-70 family)